MNVFSDSIPSSLFSYNSLTKTFSAEASCLNGYDILQRSSLNRTSRGFAMKSKKTGREVPFFFAAKLEQLEEYDGELHGWKFTSDWDATPTGESYVCIIWND